MARSLRSLDRWGIAPLFKHESNCYCDGTADRALAFLPAADSAVAVSAEMKGFRELGLSHAEPKPGDAQFSRSHSVVDPFSRIRWGAAPLLIPRP
jgi:hypothetical protein